MGSVLNIQVGDYVEISFFDHSWDLCPKEVRGELIPCKARGRVLSVDPNKIILQSWEAIVESQEDYEDNQEIITIACKLITAYQTFIPWKKVKLY